MEVVDNTVVAFKTTRYRCPHCAKTGANRKRMQEHADACIADPATMACRTCKADVEYRLPSDDGLVRTEKGCASGVREYGVKLVKRCPHWHFKV